MSETVQLFNAFLAAGGLVAGLGAALLLLDLFTKQRLQQTIAQWGIVATFALTTVSVVTSLMYSEVFGFVPCGLCWLQRVFLYPLVIMTAMALLYKEKVVARYGIALSVPGLFIALYHHYLQLGGSALIACPQSGGDCTKRYLFEFGFVTFPLISALLFFLILAIFLYILKAEKQQSGIFTKA